MMSSEFHLVVETSNQRVNLIGLFRNKIFLYVWHLSNSNMCCLLFLYNVSWHKCLNRRNNLLLFIRNNFLCLSPHSSFLFGTIVPVIPHKTSFNKPRHNSNINPSRRAFPFNFCLGWFFFSVDV